MLIKALQVRYFYLPVTDGKNEKSKKQNKLIIRKNKNNNYNNMLI